MKWNMVRRKWVWTQSSLRINRPLILRHFFRSLLQISALDRQIKTMHTSKEKLKTDLIRAAEKSQRDMLKMQSGLSAVQTELEKTELKLFVSFEFVITY